MNQVKFSKVLKDNIEYWLLFYLLLAKLNAFVIVPVDYPNMTPLFSLELDWHGRYSRENSEAIRVCIYS